MSFFIETLDGIRLDLKSQGINPLKLEIDSASPRHLIENIDGQDGFIELETTYDGRTLRASFFIEAKDNYSFLRSVVFHLFDAKTLFYIIDSEEPHKRWKVRTASKFTPQRLNRMSGNFTVELISPSPFAQSPGTTLNPSDYTQMNQVQEANFGDPPIQYRFAETSFFVWNDGEKVDPRQHYLQIAFKGASNNLAIKNLTNGTEWRYNGSSTSGDVILLDGIKSLKNGVSVFRYTNKKLIELAKGWNEFKIFGSTDFEISFDFKYLYI